MAQERGRTSEPAGGHEAATRPMSALIRRGEKLVDEVAQRSTETTRMRVRRLSRTALPILQSAVAAAAAYLIAHRLLGHPEPFFAPIAAVLSLGVSLGQRTRRSLEVVVGVAVGVLVADALVALIGRGTVQIALFVALAMVVAVLAGGGPLVVNQGAASAILIATLAPIGDQNAFGFSRFTDALVGGLVGLTVNALLLPLNPVVIARRAANRVLSELAGTLDDIAHALAAGEIDGARAALRRAAATEQALNDFDNDLSAGRELTRIAPARWRMHGHLTQYVEAATHIVTAVHDVRVLARRATVMLRVGEEVGESLPPAISRLAESVRTLQNELAKGVQPRAARSGLVHAAELATATTGGRQGFSGNVIVAQVRSTGLDLLQASGLSRKDAEQVFDELQPPVVRGRTD